jgi:hypothetical protein
MARKVDGSIWTWGGDDYGQLGNGAVTVENQFYPARVNQFVINNLENVYNTCAVFDELSINEEDYYDSATGMSTFKVWMKVVSTYFPTPQTGFIFKDWTLLTPEINPRKRVKEIIRGVYEPLL